MILDIKSVKYFNSFCCHLVAKACPTLAHQSPHLWAFPGKNIGVGCHFLLQGIFLTQGLNLSPALAGSFFTIIEPPDAGYSPWSCKRVEHDLVTKQSPYNLPI